MRFIDYNMERSPDRGKIEVRKDSRINKGNHLVINKLLL